MTTTTTTTKPTGASMARHRSEQDVETPPDLFGAVVDRFGSFTFDLAATPANAKALLFFTPEQDALTQSWSDVRGNAWLNPPFSDVAPWASKCVRSMRPGMRIFMLVPASVGANWWRSHVHDKAGVLFLSPRVRFVGHTGPFPKDLALVIYGGAHGYDCWRWRP